MDIESQWAQFMNEDFDVQELQSYDFQLNDSNNVSTIENKEVDIPNCTSLNISTKTKGKTGNTITLIRGLGTVY